MTAAAPSMQSARSERTIFFPSAFTANHRQAMTAAPPKSAGCADQLQRSSAVISVSVAATQVTLPVSCADASRSSGASASAPPP